MTNKVSALGIHVHISGQVVEVRENYTLHVELQMSRDQAVLFCKELKERLELDVKETP